MGQNVGHGHVFPRPDGVRARCGGPGICRECSIDLGKKVAAETHPNPVLSDGDDAGLDVAEFDRRFDEMLRAERAQTKATFRPHGCICPVGAEATCKGPLCPRKPIGSAA